MAENQLIPLVRKNLITYANAAVGSTLFQHIYVRDAATGEERDTMENGFLSCASFLSTILAMLSLIDRPHSTVAATLKTMHEAGWVKVSEPREGAVVHWAAGPLGHEHIGFCVGESQVISNHSGERTPQRHGLEHPTTPGLMPDYYLWHPKLEQE